jgi:hypothetical protein
MAARRLVALMLVLLAVSTLAAALTAPAPEREPRTTEDAGEPRSRNRSGRLIEGALDASSRRPDTVEVQSGDQLALTVRSPIPGQVEIPAFGLLEDVAPRAPARFDLLLERPGRFEVRLAGRGRLIGAIVVRPRRVERGPKGPARP